MRFPAQESLTMTLNLIGNTRRMAPVAVLLSWLWGAAPATAQDRSSGIAASKADVQAMTSLWKGDRSADGRPRVPDDLLQRIKAVTTDEAWEVLRNFGYHHQFEGGWQILHPDEPFVGR